MPETGVRWRPSFGPAGTTRFTIEDDYEPAGDEHWGVFDCDGSDNGPVQIQRIDEDEEVSGWTDDIEAWQHVVARAMAGSDLHQRALSYVGEHNPIELRRIWHFTGGQW